MQIISNYRYVYYKINNKQTGENYYGLFDIKTNKIMFNTNVSLDTFLPYSSNSMLAIKGNEVYRICPIMSGDENNCLEDCTEGLKKFLLFLRNKKCQNLLMTYRTYSRC